MTIATATQPFWRKEPPIFHDNGSVKVGGMWPHQKDWWELDNFIKILVGGYGCGKTLIGSKWLISMALANAPYPVASISPTFPLARNTVIPTLQELLRGKQTILGRKLSFKFNAAYHEFTIKYGGRVGRIPILSGDKPESLRGSNLAAALIDEPFIQEESVFQQVLARVRHPNAPFRSVGLTGTPEQLNWGYDLCVGKYASLTNVAYIQASTKDNLALPDEYVKTLTKFYSKQAADAYIEGGFVNLTEGLVYYGFRNLEYPTGNILKKEIPQGAELGVGIDFNVNPMTAVVFWRIKDHMHYFKEYELPNADTEYLSSTLRQDFPALVEAFPDASGVQRATQSPGGRSDFWYLRNAGFTIRARPSNPPRKDRYNSVNGKLNPKDGDPTITIDPGCIKLVKYLQTYSHELALRQKEMSHLTDALSYPAEYLFPVARSTITVHKLKGF
jgi:hypothetical protein